MNNSKRGRGRPIGTGLDDTPTLTKIADLLINHPGLKPTTAIRRVINNPGASLIRRLQVKWKAGSPKYLAAALAERECSQQSGSEQRILTTNSRCVARQLIELNRTFVETMSPAIRAMQEVDNSSIGRAMREMRDSPTLRAMQEMDNSPTQRAMREMHDSPTMRAIREATERLAKFSSKSMSKALDGPASICGPRPFLNSTTWPD